MSGLALIVAALIFSCMYGMVVADMAITTAFGQLFQGGLLDYNAQLFKAYARTQYDFYFANTANNEDNFLIVILPREEGEYQFDYVAVTGDHVDVDLKDYLGEDAAVLGDTEMPLTEYSTFDSRLTNFINNKIRNISTKFNRETALDCREASFSSSAQLINTTDLKLDDEKIRQTMNTCKQELEMGLVVIVADQDEVFDRYLPIESVITLAITSVVAVVLIIGLVFLIRDWRSSPLNRKRPASKEKLVQHDKLDEEYWKDRY